MERHLLGFKSFLTEKGLTPAELLKPNGKTGELRTDILSRLIKDKTPIELDDGSFLVVTKIPEAQKAINQFKIDNKAFILIGKLDGKGKEITVSSSKIKKSAVFGSGGGSAGGSANTALAESAQAYYCSAVCNILGKAAKPEQFTPAVLKKAAKFVDADISIEDVIRDLPEDWVESSILTANQLMQDGYITKGHVFYRGKGVMKVIYDGARTAQKNTAGITPLADDKWNPGDIWAAKSSFNPKSLDSSNINSYNKDILEAFLERDCVAISLKKVVGGAHIERYNVEPAREQHKYLGFGLSAAKGGGTIENFFASKGMALYVDAVIMEGRTFNFMTNFAVDIRGKNSRGGKIGLGPINTVLSLNGAKPLTEAGSIKQKASKMDPAFMKEFYKMKKRLKNSAEAAKYRDLLLQNQNKIYYQKSKKKTKTLFNEAKTQARETKRK